MASEDEYQQRQFHIEKGNIYPVGVKYVVDKRGGIWRPIIIPTMQEFMDNRDGTFRLTIKRKTI